MDEAQEPESDSTPFHHQRVFGGAGLKRKRIDFVRESAPSTTISGASKAPRQPLGDLYLSIVLPPQPPCAASTSTCTNLDETSHGPSQVPSPLQASAPSKPPTSSPAPISPSPPGVTLCPICNLTLSSSSNVPTPTPHESTLAHQLALAHSHPPSHLDRRSKGLAYLSAYGWDPDARIGLGAEGAEGRLDPVKATRRGNRDRRGIGVEEEGKGEVVDRGKVDGKNDKERRGRRRAEEEKMRALVYGKDEVNKYLGIEL